MKTASLAAGIFATLAVLALVATADPVEDAIRTKLVLPPALGVARVYMPASLATADPDQLVVESPRDPRSGRASVKVVYRGKIAWVPVTLAPVVDVAVTRRAIAAGAVIGADDISIERRAAEDIAPTAAVVGSIANRELAADAPIGTRDVTLPAPLARGTQVAVDVRRGNVRIKGTGILEAAARPGQPASVRLAFNKTIVRGVLVAPDTVVVGDRP